MQRLIQGVPLVKVPAQIRGQQAGEEQKLCPTFAFSFLQFDWWNKGYIPAKL
jgi:hypothetical protein